MSATRDGITRRSSATAMPLPHHRFLGWRDPPNDHALAVHHRGDLRRDDVLPLGALIDGGVQGFALLLAVEAANPDVEIVLFRAGKAADDDHPLGELPALHPAE